MPQKNNNLIYLFTGNGKGKTTAALGMALRAVGQNHKVVVIQFLKGRKDAGELKIKKRLGPKYEIYQFGRRGFVNLRKPAPLDIILAQRGLAFAKEIAKKKRPSLLILDELNLVARYGLIPIKEVISFLRKLPQGIDIVLTGREVPQELLKMAGGVSEIRNIKSPFNRGVSARKGIEY